MQDPSHLNRAEGGGTEKIGGSWQALGEGKTRRRRGEDEGKTSRSFKTPLARRNSLSSVLSLSLSLSLPLSLSLSLFIQFDPYCALIYYE